MSNIKRKNPKLKAPPKKQTTSQLPSPATKKQQQPQLSSQPQPPSPVTKKQLQPPDRFERSIRNPEMSCFFSSGILFASILFVYMDLLANIDQVAEAYPGMDGADCAHARYRCHFWWLTKLFFRVILTWICLMIATWFVLMFVVDIVLPFLCGTDMKSPGTTPEVKSFVFAYLPKSGFKPAVMPSRASPPCNGWVFVRNAIILHLTLLIASLVFMRPDTMRDKEEVRARIKTFLVISMVVMTLLVLREVLTSTAEPARATGTAPAPATAGPSGAPS
jgi:hypothetical protein